MSKPGIKIKLDKQRNLRYPLKALLECEEYFNVPYTQFKPQEWKLKDIVFLLTVGLKEEDPEITEEKVIELIDEAESLEYIFNKIAEAWTLAFVGKKGIDLQST